MSVSIALFDAQNQSPIAILIPRAITPFGLVRSIVFRSMSRDSMTEKRVCDSASDLRTPLAKLLDPLAY